MCRSSFCEKVEPLALGGGHVVKDGGLDGEEKVIPGWGVVKRPKRIISFFMFSFSLD